MKKYCTLLLLCFVGMTTMNAQYTAIPDANFEAALSTYDDIPNDGQILTENIETVTSLNVSSKNISDLTGIEAFTELTSLNCASNSITNLDVSSNLKLTELTCYFNGMTSIDVSKNTELIELECYFNNLTSIDVSQNTNLKVLEVYSNDLISIDVSQNTLLEELLLQRNDLTVIDISKNIVLKELNITSNNISSLNLVNNTSLIDLSARNNNLSELDLTALTIENFTHLSASGNDFTCISVNNPNYAYQNFPSNAYDFSIECDTYTYIADINFEAYLNSVGLDDVVGDYSVRTSAINSVTSLNIPDNSNIDDLTGIEAFTALESLTINNNNLTNLDISNNTALKQLSCTNNALETIHLSNNLLLESLICDGNQISGIDVSANTALTSLSISRNPIIKLDLSVNTALEKLYAVATDIIQLDLMNNSILQELVITNGPLVSLNLKNGNNTNIVDLDLRNNTNLTCAVVDDVAYANSWANVDNQLTFNDTSCAISEYTLIPDTNFETSLYDLGLDNIENDGQVPTRYIENTISLDLGGSSVLDITGIEDFTSLEILRVNNTSIPDLDLSGNETIKELYAYQASTKTLNLSNMTALEFVACYRSGVDNLIVTNATALREIQAYNTDFVSLDVSTNTSLEKLVCYESLLENLNTTGATNLKELIVYRSSLQSLDISSNKALEKVACYEQSSLTAINTHGASALKELYVYRTGVTEIDVTSNTALTLLHSYNTKLSSFNIVGLTNLRDLDISFTETTSLDVSTNTGLTNLNVSFNDLVSLDLRNGNNTNLTSFDATANTDLDCIMVDDVSYAETNFTNVDSGLTFSTTTCGYTLIPDANFEAALSSYDDVPGDGKVPTQNIENLTSLDVSLQFPNIEDITGIEAFKALETLSFDTQSVDEADLTSNIHLTSINFSSNGLKTLNITGLTKLEEIICSGGSLKTLDVSTNINLKKINVREQSIRSLDVSMLPQLIDLNCSFNFLTYLNLKNGNNTNFIGFNAINNPSLTCIQVDDVPYATTNFTNIDNTVSFSEYCNGIVVSPTAILEGAFEFNMGNIVMHDNLRDHTPVLIPTTSPYNANESCEPSIFDISGENAVVDWVEVQLRDENDNTQIIASKSALLLRNGTITDIDGRSSVPFDESEGNYYVALRHRNHVTILSNVTFALSGTTTLIDLINTTNVIGGTSALIGLGDGFNGIPLGDTDENGQVQNEDISSTIIQLGISGYNHFDVDMNGQVQNADVNRMIQNIGKGEQF